LHAVFVIVASVASVTTEAKIFRLFKLALFVFWNLGSFGVTSVWGPESLWFQKFGGSIGWPPLLIHVKCRAQPLPKNFAREIPTL